MRDRPRGRVSLVLPDDAEGLPAPVVAHESDGAAELHDPSARIGHHELRADTSRVPVANVSRCFGESFSIAARLSVSVRALRGDKLRFDLRQSGSRDIVRARRDWPVRDITDESIFVYESSAHTEQVGTLRPVASAVERPRLVLRPKVRMIRWLRITIQFQLCAQCRRRDDCRYADGESGKRQSQILEHEPSP